MDCMKSVVEDGFTGSDQPWFPLERDKQLSVPGKVAFAVVLLPKTLEKFFSKSGDRNRGLHHQVEGRGAVQAVVWTILANAAISEIVPGAMVLSASMQAHKPCIVRDSPVVVWVWVTTVESGEVMVEICRSRADDPARSYLHFTLTAHLARPRSRAVP